MTQPESKKTGAEFVDARVDGRVLILFRKNGGRLHLSLATGAAKEETNDN